ncbi:MAG: hypothetical protein HY332_24480 [Chloroflexi bacterium]|nr:hypothetical protein [Chloroflexota bacterium]
MPGWQQFYAQHASESFELVSVAVEFQGADAARPWLERAGTTFPTIVDESNVLGEFFGYKAIPNGIFLDERGVVRYLKFGGFSVGRAEDVAAIEQLLRHDEAAQSHGGGLPAQPGALSGASGSRPAAGTTNGSAEPHTRVQALEEGLALLRRGDRAGAVAAWRRALADDPDNYVIRKQIWAVEHPERFYPTIDWAWQKEQRERERST